MLFKLLHTIWKYQMRYAYVPLMAMVISTNCAGSEIPEVTLQEQNYQGIIQLVGDLDVGEVDSQSEIDKQFILINKSDTKLSFAGVRPTCSCTNVVLKKGSIERVPSGDDCKALVP